MMPIAAKLSRNRLLLLLFRWASPLIDPVRFMTGIVGYRRFFSAWRTYAHMPGAEPIRVLDTYPQIHDHTSLHTLDTHYFYTNGWAMRRILVNMPARHVDVGSQIIFANLLAAVIPVTFIEYRPLHARLDGLECVAGDILALPYNDDSVSSLSCLHVAEHIGLGRYGDPLDPQGTKKAARELCRVLAPGGNLFFVVPVGRPALYFNAHRTHAPQTIRDYFASLELVEFSGVFDDGQFVERVSLDEFRHSSYACGMFWFRKSTD